MNRNKAIAWLYGEIPQLVKKGIMSDETAENIQKYFGKVDSKSKVNIALAIFGVIGAVCIGLGIMLLFAYNWDMFSKFQRTVLAFTPLIISSLMVMWAVAKDVKSIAIREGFAVLNMLAVGGCISLISQIYNLPGDIDTFLLTWMILSIPLVYLLNASLTSILYLAGVTTWSAMAQNSGGHAVLFWPLVALVIPHYLKHMKVDRFASKAIWLSSAICLCLTVGIGISMEKVMPGLWIIVYSSFFACLYLIGKIWFDETPYAWQKPFRNYGMLGTVIVSYLFTFKWVWREIGWNYYRSGGRFHSLAGVVDYIVVITLVILAVTLLVRIFEKGRLLEVSFGAAPLLAIGCYALTGVSNGGEFLSTWVYNLFVLYLGIITVLSGIKDKHLGIMNAGILMMAVIIFTRFVDSSLGIMTRGIIFIIIGVCFVATNMIFSKQFSGEDKKSEGSQNDK